MNREEAKTIIKAFLGKNATTKIANENGRRLYKVGISQENGQMLTKGQGYTWDEAVKNARERRRQEVINEDKKIKEDEDFHNIKHEIIEKDRAKQIRGHRILDNHSKKRSKKTNIIVSISIVILASLITSGIYVFNKKSVLDAMKILYDNGIIDRHSIAKGMECYYKGNYILPIRDAFNNQCQSFVTPFGDSCSIDYMKSLLGNYNRIEDIDDTWRLIYFEYSDGIIEVLFYTWIKKDGSLFSSVSSISIKRFND